MLLYRCSQGEFSKIVFALEKDWCKDYSSTGVKFKFTSAYIDQDVTATHFENHSNIEYGRENIEPSTVFH